LISVRLESLQHDHNNDQQYVFGVLIIVMVVL